MSQNLIDDLEEGEIADDITLEPEPVIEKKRKPLPRRYIVNDRKTTPKHKRNCKHAAQHHKHNSKCDSPSNLKLHKKHRKACPKHKVVFHNKLSINNLNLKKCDSLMVDLNDRGSPYNYLKPSIEKSAFKNFTSPPRRVSKPGAFNSMPLPPPENTDSFPKLLSEYKNSQNKLKFKNISNLKKQNKLPCKISPGKNADVVAKQRSCENLPPVETKLNTDDEDEEELRRIALATCMKKPITDEVESSNSEIKISATELHTVESDNYEVIDMDVDNDAENVQTVDNDLFVIDTTPSYFDDQQGLNAHVGQNFNNDLNTCFQNNDFIPSLNIEEPFQNFSSDVNGHNLNNALYLNFDTVLVNESHLPSSQLDDDFEEELLRAELIANMKSMRKKVESENSLRSANTVTEGKISLESQVAICMDSKVDRNENTFKKDTPINLKNDSRNENSFHERVVSIESGGVSKIEPVLKERTVSIVTDISTKENTSIEKSRSVSTVYPKHDVPLNATIKNGVDIKVKLNNLRSSNTNAALSGNKITLPQERIIISLNNESSSEDSDQEDTNPKSLPVENSAVASLEALISNARHESDGKKESPGNSSSTSNAVSWLSKAQQEEYNSLKKILEKKQPLLVKTVQNAVKKTSEESGLILLRKKILIARRNLEKEKDLMNNTMKDLVKKKRSYMVSKLRTQHLKEQLLAAERVRKSNLQLWTKCSSGLQILKKSVSKRQAIINSLQTKINSTFPEFGNNGLSPISNNVLDPENNLSL